MRNITSSQLRSLYLDFFRERRHAPLPSASLVPANDPSVLFTTAGMHPLVPYLLGEPHPAGTRLANVQRCVRTGDIDVVGDDRPVAAYAAVMARALAAPVEYRHVPRERYAALDIPNAREVADMFDYYRRFVPTRADALRETRALFPAVRSFERWMHDRGAALARALAA